MVRPGLIASVLCVFAWTQTVAAQALDRVVAAHYPPLIVSDDTAQPGYAIEVLQEAARRAGRTIDITFLPFERAMFSLKSTSDTLMPALFFGKKSNDAFLWVAEIQRARMVFATVSDRVDSLESARALPSIVVEGGTTADALLADLQFDNVVRVQSPAASASMLASGRVAAWFQEAEIIPLAWQSGGQTAPLVLGAVVHEIPIFLVASLDLPDATAAAYRQSVDAMRADGTLGRLWSTYSVAQ